MTTTSPKQRGATGAAVLVSAALLLAGCSGASPATSTASTESAMRSFTADNGTVQIPAHPQRIVALADNTQTFLELGIEPIAADTKVTGDQVEWLTAEQQKANDAIVEVGDDVDYEKVAGLKPDLIVVYGLDFTFDGYDQEKLEPIAPTIYLNTNDTVWYTVAERLADAVDALDVFNESKSQYETLVGEIQDGYADLIGSTTFSFLNRWSNAEASEFAVEYDNSYCTEPASDVGLTLLPDPRDEGLEAGYQGPGGAQSMENLSDLAAAVDVIVYPLAADGQVRTEFASVIDTSIWKTLPQVEDGRALGVRCNLASNTYAGKLPALESLGEALATLSGS